jgi:hypothetical protein
MKLKNIALAAVTCLTASTIVYAGDPANTELPKTSTVNNEEVVSSVLVKKGGSSDGPRMVVKFNLFGLAVRNLPFQFEYAFHKNMSGALGVSMLIPRGLPSSFTGGAEFGDLKFRGYSITPEFRFYPGKKEEHQAPHGFYFAPYARYQNFSFTASGSYANTDTATGASSMYKAEMKAYYKGLGFGMMIGAQWLLGEHITLDWYILGGHYGSGKAGLTVTAPEIGKLSPQDKAEVEKSANDAFEQIGSEVSVKYSGNTADFSIPAKIIGIRGLGLAIGYAF